MLVLIFKYPHYTVFINSFSLIKYITICNVSRVNIKQIKFKHTFYNSFSTKKHNDIINVMVKIKVQKAEAYD